MARARLPDRHIACVLSVLLELSLILPDESFSMLQCTCPQLWHQNSSTSISSITTKGTSCIIHQASNLPIPSPPFSSPLTFFPPIALFHLPGFVGLVPPAATFSLLAFAHPFLLSLAHAPQDEMYAPAFCPAACTEACAAVRSGARAAKRCVGGRCSEGDSLASELALTVP